MKNQFFTIIIHSKTKDDVLAELKNQCKKVKEIQNSFKKNQIFALLNKFTDHINGLPNGEINCVYYISNDELNKENIKKNFCLEWNIPSYQFMYDECFQNEYIDDIFKNTNYRHGIQVDKKITHWIGTKHKKKVFKEYKSIDDLNSVTVNFVMYGKVKATKVGKAISIINGNLSWVNVIEEYEKYEMRMLHKKLNDVLKMIQTSSEKLIYKAEIQQSLEDFRIKELYLMMDYEIDIPSDSNVQITRVNVLENGDPADVLKRDFEGIVGVAFY